MAIFQLLRRFFCSCFQSLFLSSFKESFKQYLKNKSPIFNFKGCSFLKLLIIIPCIFFSSFSLAQDTSSPKTLHSLALLGTPKYPDNFTHTDYVFPDAPKGGRIVLSALGTFDNFNRYAVRGSAAQRTDKLYDSLFTYSLDENSSLYPLIGTEILLDIANGLATVKMNPSALFHDGKVITAEDYLFSFNKLMTEGIPQFRKTYEKMSIEVLDPHTLVIHFPTKNLDDLSGLLTIPIFPKHFWQHYSLKEPLTIPPLGSGPYKIKEYKMGQFVTYSRVNDYWAQDLPINKGMFNFDEIRYDYYLDSSVTFEAFKSGAFDVQQENSAKNWNTLYVGDKFNDGSIIKLARESKAAQNTQWLVFNVTNTLFSDIRVREAIMLAYDFEWINKHIFYGNYKRQNSFFQNTEYAAQGYPTQQELDILTPFKDKLPATVFKQQFEPPKSNGDGYNRENLLLATTLLKEAGWVVKNGRLVHQVTNKPFEFELLVYAGSTITSLIPFQQNLKRLGISLTFRKADSSQYTQRMRARDYDMIVSVYPAMPFPSADLQYFWHSQFIDSTYNAPGVNNPVIDTLIDEIIKHQGDEKSLIPLGKALDRVLTANIYMFPQTFSGFDRFAYWNKFGLPDIYPANDIGLDTWWNKAQTRQQITNSNDQ